MKWKKFVRWLLAIPASIILPFVIINVVSFNDEKIETIADSDPYQVTNGGFETGTLDGWTAYRIWKDEPGMAAFDVSLVHGKNYFSHDAGAGHPYGKDGSYQLGITSEADQYTGTIQWDQAAERMGYLKSSNFVLGGSGWISFKLGGGKYPEFAYVSICKTTDNTEVARFGNRWFNNTTLATTVFGSSITNAEAFLFPYYFDLSTVASLGTSLYIRLCDTSAYEWSILSADSFVTYYVSTPSPGADDLAINILPTIEGIATASNSIPNGNPIASDTGWTFAGTGWGRDGDSMKSNRLTGNGDIGILRSSAFTVSTDKYLQLEWAGGLAYDKRIFISVKEAYTNIEMLRFVRRNDRSSEISGNWQNHMLDLTSLDSGKIYYLEFADNISSGDWSVSYVRSIRIITVDEWNEVTSGDRAVCASGSAVFARSFIQKTGPICEAMTGDFSSVWGTLETEYSSLGSDARNYFTASGTPESTILAARERYVFIINKYPSLTKFVVNGNGDVYPGTSNVIGYDFGSNSQTIIIIVISLMAISAGAFFLFARRRKEIV